MKHLKSRLIRKQPVFKKVWRPVALSIATFFAMIAVLGLSHITWFPNLLQIVADNLDANKYYQTADQEYALMFENYQFCTKNTDCEIVCRPSQYVTDCNSYAKNWVNENRQACTERGCRQQLFTYTVCQHNQCIIRGF